MQRVKVDARELRDYGLAKTLIDIYMRANNPCYISAFGFDSGSVCIIRLLPRT